MTDTISRQAAIDALKGCYCGGEDSCGEPWIYEDHAIKAIEQLPSAQPEVKQISYTDCANAMLMMWMDKVLTDGEYNRIMDKLNEHEKKKKGRQ